MSSMRQGGIVRAVGIWKSFDQDGSPLPVLENIHLHAASGEFVAIVGPSGCGKSTLLDIICGLTTPDQGVVSVNDQPHSGPGQIAYMPQRDSLLPWRRLLDNVILGLEIRGVPRTAALEQARTHLALFGLAGFERAYPHELSGGMRQRAALLRTFLAGDTILALDEPFGALDALTRREMQVWLDGVWRRLGATVVLVTHDIEEALFLADRLYVLCARPAQVSAEIPIDLARPRDPVAPEFNELRRLVTCALRDAVKSGC